MEAHRPRGRKHQQGCCEDLEQAKTVEVQMRLRSPYILDQTRNSPRNGMTLLDCEPL